MAGFIGVIVIGAGPGMANTTAKAAKMEVALGAAVRAAGDILANTMKDLCPVDLGDLRDSISVESHGPTSVTVGPRLFYAPYVEFGAGPHFPNLDRLGAWADRHGMTPGQIVSSIAANGVQAHPFVVPSIEVSRGQMEDVMLTMDAIILS
jgi:phage protein, HK97 gp10 family